MKRKNKGQSIGITLGALASCNWPVLIDLTDGDKHHLLTIKGKTLIIWESLSSEAAYFKMAQSLKEDTALDGQHSLSSIDLDVDEATGGYVDKDFREMKKVRSSIKVVSSLQEQLDSVLPFLSDRLEKYNTAYEIIASHVASTEQDEEDDDDAGKRSFLQLYT